MRKLTTAARRELQKVIDRNSDILAKPNVIDVRPGFAIRDGKLVRNPAIIAYVDKKLPQNQLLSEELVPETIEGISVDVVVADPWTQLAILQHRGEFLPAQMPAAAAKVKYEGLTGDPIDEEYEIEKPVLCCVGPDVGWTVLSDFLGKTKTRLTVCMYDFSSSYIAAKLIENARDENVKIQLTIDDGLKSEEKQLQSKIKRALKDTYSSAVIHCGATRRFPTAYHPKVAVQDGKRFWLSSGNWSPNSQPEIDPIGSPAEAKGMYSRANREWHVQIEDKTLSALFERYILHDKQQAEGDAGLGFERSDERPDLFVPLSQIEDISADAALAVVTPVAPERLPREGSVRVQPLLSPDNYAKRLGSWIKKAKKSLFLQFAYIHYSEDAQDAVMRKVLDLLAELSWRDDFDLRIILGSSQNDARLLAENGFNEASLRRQSKVHNKGIVLDGREVLVSSQNWSGDGFLRNRDAGVILKNRQIAGYFSEVFLFDWEKRARDPFKSAGLSAVIARPHEKTPPGMVRMSWSDYIGE